MVQSENEEKSRVQQQGSTETCERFRRNEGNDLAKPVLGPDFVKAKSEIADMPNETFTSILGLLVVLASSLPQVSCQR